MSARAATPKSGSARAASRPVATRGVQAILKSAWMDPVLLALVLAVAAWVYLPTAARVGYNTDEGQFIAAAEYFELAFLKRQLSGPAWEPNYLTLTQPMLSRFILGAGIRVAGLEPPPLNIRYRESEVNPATRGRYWERETFRDERKLAEERRVDRPSAAVLQAARAPMVLLAVIGAGLLFVTGRMLAGPVAGLVAAAVAVWNPTMLTLLPRAHAESPLYVFTLAALALGLTAARLSPKGRCLWLGLGCGVAAGLAVSAKLTGTLLAAALLGYAVIALLLWLPVRGQAPAVAWRWSTLAVIAAMIVTVAMNPFLYPNPVGRLQEMLAFRQQEMFGQAVLSENEAVPPGLGARLPLLADRMLLDLATLNKRTGVPFDIPLIGLGLLTLAAGIGRQRTLQAVLGAEGLMLICCVVTVLGLAWNLGLDWARYYMPMLTLTSLLIGIGSATLLRGIRVVARMT
ncbi:MAG: glycosyltransferase family 39 protein [Chloroflexota bacterium]